jgi:ribose 5-phosphate isomerase A
VSADALKQSAAERAVALVEDGMALGLGTGSTAAHFVAAVGRRVAEGLDVVCVPTSLATQRQAERLGIPLTTLDARPRLDLTVDGADEIDDRLRAIKGGGGALLCEKIVAAASARMVVIADGSKRVGRLGAFPLPIEVVRFGAESTRLRLAAALADTGLAADPVLRRHASGAPFVTDEGHLIMDVRLGPIADAAELAAVLSSVPGVVEHGLFLGLVTGAVLGTASGLVELGQV